MIADVRTDEGLRDALMRVPDEGGWDGPLGRLLLDTLAQVAHRWCPRDTRVVDPHRRTHMLGVAWEFLMTNPRAVIDARSPWAMLDRSMRRRGGHAAMADEMSTSERRASRFTRAEILEQLPARPRPSTRVDPQSSEAAVFDVAGVGRGWFDPVGDEAVGHVEPEHTATDGWDPALQALLAELVAAGAPERETTEAINSVVDAAASTTSKSRMHTAIYRSVELAGLTHQQRRALAELIIGTRSGGTDESTWVALRRTLAMGNPPEAGWSSSHRQRVAQFATPFHRSQPPALAIAS